MLTLYIHFPWCIRKCPYCDFNSHPLRGEIPEQTYITALIKDLTQSLPLIQDRKISAIFLGGGTPSLFSPKALAELFSAIRARTVMAADIEITLEANPGTVEQSYFEGYRAIGINRLSLGAQSFNDEMLKRLGRIHNAAEITKAVLTAKKAGFDNFNIDIMFGLPQQTQGQALEDLIEAISMQPTHLSWYELTLEPNTLFYKKPPTLPMHDDLFAMTEQGQQLLKQQGYQAYEISAYAKNGYRCRHNLNYWQFGDYLGIGAGAHSKLTDRNAQSITRYWRHKHPNDYMSGGEFIAGSQIVPRNELPLEFMMNALRLCDPIPLKLFEQQTFLPLQEISEQIKQAEQAGFLNCRNDEIVLTEKGKFMHADLLELF